ncbi:transposase [Cryobacterium sp. M91]|uniref:transposase n=1 Tax=Cryobacterium sp. M91 TaxID=2048294 RepID=UPI0021015869|nr:transposase [Cryobacterium sp. M91]
MPKKHPTEVRERAVRMTLDRLKDYPSMWAACRDLAPKLNIGAETLRKWVTQAQADAGERTGPTSEELEEIKRLKRENRDLRETNDILKAAASFLSSGSSTLATVPSRFHPGDEGERPWSRVDVRRPARAGRRCHFTVMSGMEDSRCRRASSERRGPRRPSQSIESARRPGSSATRDPLWSEEGDGVASPGRVR